MDAINNINALKVGQGSAYQAATTSRATDDSPATANANSLGSNGQVQSVQDIEELATALGASLTQLGQGHKVEIRREEETGRPIVEVRSKDGILLNQFPPEKVLNLRRVLADLSGVVINRMT